MEDLTWAVRCANVGIKGGALLLVATVVLFAAGLGADGFLFTIAALLIVATYVTIFVVALKSAIYYKGDSVNKVVSENTLTVDGDDINSAIESIKESIKNNNGHPIDNIAGYSYKVEEKDGKVHITWETDFNKLDFNKYKAAVNVPENSLDETRKLSSVEKNLTNNGLKEKK